MKKTDGDKICLSEASHMKIRKISHIVVIIVNHQ